MFPSFLHGLAFILNHACHEITVWDPIDGYLCRMAVPPGRQFDGACLHLAFSNFAVLCDNHLTDRASLDAFKVVLLCAEGVTFDADPQVCWSNGLGPFILKH